MLSYLDPTNNLIATATARGRLAVNQGIPPRLLWQRDLPAALTALAWSSDGACLATGDAYGVISVWCVRTSRLLARARTHQEAIHCLMWSPSGSRLVSATLHDPRPRLREYPLLAPEADEEVYAS